VCTTLYQGNDLLRPFKSLVPSTNINDAGIALDTGFFVRATESLAYSAALTLYVCVSLLQKWGLLGCGTKFPVCSGCCAGVDGVQMDKVCC